MQGGVSAACIRFTCHTKASLCIRPVAARFLLVQGERQAMGAVAGFFLLRVAHNGVSCALLALPDPHWSAHE